MNLITVTSESGSPITINAEYIVFYETWRTNSSVLTAISLRDSNRVMCKETPIEISKLIFGVNQFSKPNCNKEHVDDVKKTNIYTDL